MDKAELRGMITLALKEVWWKQVAWGDYTVLNKHSSRWPG